MRKILGMFICLLFICSLLNITGCSHMESKTESADIVWMMKKDEQMYELEELMKIYEEKKGCSITVQYMGDEGTDEIRSYISSLKSDNKAVILIQDNDRKVKALDDLLFDFRGDKKASDVLSDGLIRYTDSGRAVALPLEISSMGIICSDELLKESGINEDSIKSFRDLKNAAKRIHEERYEKYDAFAPASLKTTEDLDTYTALLNCEMYYENEGENVSELPVSLTGEYMENLREISGMMTSCSCAETETLPYVDYDALSDFGEEHAVFMTGSSDDYYELVNGYRLKADTLSMLPLYYGVDDENQSMCVRVNKYISVADGSELCTKSALDLLDYLLSGEGKEMFSKIYTSLPYESSTSDNSLINDTKRIIQEKGNIIPLKLGDETLSDEYRNSVLSALKEYCTDEQHSFAGVTEAMVSMYSAYEKNESTPDEIKINEKVKN